MFGSMTSPTNERLVIRAFGRDLNGSQRRWSPTSATGVRHARAETGGSVGASKHIDPVGLRRAGQSHRLVSCELVALQWTVPLEHEP